MLPGRFRIPAANAGTHLLLEVNPEVDDRRLSRLAARYGLDTPPLSPHYLGGPRRKGLLVNYASADLDRIRAGVATLRKVFDQADVPAFAAERIRQAPARVCAL